MECQAEQGFQELYTQYRLLKADAEPELRMPAEDDYGNCEYKLKLGSPPLSIVEHRITQMKFRLREGNGEAFYEVGVGDHGDVPGLDDADIRETMSDLYFMA